MSSETSRLAIMAFIALASSACQPSVGWTSETIDLGVSADLSDVQRLMIAPSVPGFFAVGTSGTVVVWEQDPRRFKKRIIRVTDLGDQDLHAVGISGFSRSWMVVGDGGTAALSDDYGASWTPVDLDVDADLHAIIAITSEGDFRTLILGDDVVLLEQPDGAWTALVPPVGGWGDLRAGYQQGWDRTYLVGLEGVIWTNEDALDPASAWVVAASGTNADLFAVEIGPVDGGDVLVAGSDGTLLGSRGPIDAGITVDFIQYEEYTLLTATGEIFEIENDYGLSSFGTFPGALGFFFSRVPAGGAVVVGIDGLVTQLHYNDPEPGF